MRRQLESLTSVVRVLAIPAVVVWVIATAGNLIADRPPARIAIWLFIIAAGLVSLKLLLEVLASMAEDYETPERAVLVSWTDGQSGGRASAAWYSRKTTLAVVIFMIVTFPFDRHIALGWRDAYQAWSGTIVRRGEDHTPFRPGRMESYVIVRESGDVERKRYVDEIDWPRCRPGMRITKQKGFGEPIALVE